MKGMTLLVNIYTEDKDILTNAEILKLLLIRCVEAADMTPLKHTLVLEHFPIHSDKGLVGGVGISGGLILVESHIYLHTWLEHGYVRLELSSCKEFNPDKVINTIKTIIGSAFISFTEVPWFAEKDT
jgi:S-adenosylmethionine decarboxylase